MKKERNETLNGITHKIETSEGTMYLTINFVDDKPFEVFVRVGKAGTNVNVLSEAIGRLISLILRSNITVSEIINQLEAVGGTADIHSSIPDSISRILKTL